jgi:hypothetical protein
MATEGKNDWRVEIDNDVASAADAICRAYGMTKAAFTEKVFADVINKVAHRHMLIQRQARGNALLSEPIGSVSDFGAL